MTEITSQLAKKGTFMQAVKQLTDEVAASWTNSGETERTALFNASKRAYTLLCSRYTAVGFWRVGKDLFSAVAAATRSPTPNNSDLFWVLPRHAYVECFMPSQILQVLH